MGRSLKCLDRACQCAGRVFIDLHLPLFDVPLGHLISSEIMSPAVDLRQILRSKHPFSERNQLMAKYLGILLLLITSFAVGCSGPQTATEEEASEGMENIENMGESPDPSGT